MNGSDHSPVATAEVVLPSANLPETIDFFADRLGFRLESIFPADSPAVAVMAGYGLRIRFQRDGHAAPGTIRLECCDPGTVADGAPELVAPNGTRILLVGDDPPLELPPLEPSLVLTRLTGDDDWITGRAGMLYRDLIPGRLGGRYIASHIRIRDGGPVPDYVHFHKIRFQLIYCLQGWVKVVYEDQGPPFVMNEGDCVLQPPGIRHRVLECSSGFEAIEIACPADHETNVDHSLALPTLTVQANREFGGQQFLRHQAAGAIWGSWDAPGFECRDLSIASASGRIAAAEVVRTDGARETPAQTPDAELTFYFVLGGHFDLCSQGNDRQRLDAGDCVVIPAAMSYTLENCADDLQLLAVRAPAAPQ